MRCVILYCLMSSISAFRFSGPLAPARQRGQGSRRAAFSSGHESWSAYPNWHGDIPPEWSTASECNWTKWSGECAVTADFGESRFNPESAAAAPAPSPSALGRADTDVPPRPDAWLCTLQASIRSPLEWKQSVDEEPRATQHTFSKAAKSLPRIADVFAPPSVSL